MANGVARLLSFGENGSKLILSFQRFIKKQMIKRSMPSQIENDAFEYAIR